MLGGRVFFLTLCSEAPAYLIDLMHDKNAEIRKVCDQTLDIIMVGYNNNVSILNCSPYRE
jgi:hypothetical protein